jgi:hypothetical protein
LSDADARIRPQCGIVAARMLPVSTIVDAKEPAPPTDAVEFDAGSVGNALA